jgi:hypothetical protein
MHELDLFMQTLCSSFHKGKTRKVFTLYEKLMNKAKKAKTVEEK